MKRSGVMEAVIAGLAGLLFYGAAALLETTLGAGFGTSALLEEAGKMLLLLGFGWSGSRAQSGTEERNPARRARSRALGLARGLSLGLVAVAVFAGTENMAYLVAFPEAGVLARLFWSLPVHLVAALVEALGVLFLFRHAIWKRGVRARFTGVSLWASSLCLAGAWHLGANALVADRLASSTFTGGVVVANLLFLILMQWFLKQAYLGGFLHGAD